MSKKIGNLIGKGLTYILFVGLAILVAIILVIRVLLLAADLIALVIQAIISFATSGLNRVLRKVGERLIHGWNSAFGKTLPVCEICYLPTREISFKTCCGRYAHSDCHLAESMRKMGNLNSFMINRRMGRRGGTRE